MSLKEHVRPYYLKWLYFRLFPRKRPAYFSDCWNFPFAQNSEHGRAPDFLFLPMTDWHTRLQRSQHLALSLGQMGHLCHYLNPHLGREFPLPVFRHRGPVVRSLAPEVREIHVHLASEPVFHHHMLTAGESRFLADALEKAIGDAQRAIQIVSFPLWLDAARRLREQRGYPIVYDCHDLLSGFRGIGPDIVAAEAELFRSSDLVVFSSLSLQRKWEAAMPEISSKSILLRNAVPDDWLAESPHSTCTRAGQTTIGYVGALDFWFDTASVAAAANTHPDWRFVLIGRIEHERVAALRHLPNVEFRGEIPHVMLRGQLGGFDAAIIPFEVNELTRCADPIKLYEYLSAGLPVVSTALPEVAPFRDVVYIATSPDDFVRKLEKAVAEDTAAKRSERKGIAAGQTWSQRAEALKNAVTSLAAGSQTPARR